MVSDLEQAIFRTVCWFSIFEYPLTVFEMWKWMWAPGRAYALAEVYEAVSGSAWLKGRLCEHDGHFALAQGPSIVRLVDGRREKYADAVRKYARLRRALRWLAAVPGIEGVAAVNTLAWSSSSGRAPSGRRACLPFPRSSSQAGGPVRHGR